MAEFTEISILHAPREPVQFNSAVSKPDASWTGINADAALMAIVSSERVQEATGLDQQGLLRRLAQQWSADSALKESVERPSNFESLRGDGISPLLKISPAMMHIDNVSLHSLARSTRGVGVADLREALEGRSSMSNPALVKAPSVSTLDHISSAGAGEIFSNRLTPSHSRTKKRRLGTRRPDEVRDVLNKLGIGQQNGNSLLKASFPTTKKTDQR